MSEPKPTPCPVAGPGGETCNARAPDNTNCWCALPAGHEGPHGWEPRHPTPAVAHPCRTPDPASGALCHLPAGHTGAHQAPGHVWEPAPIPPLSEAEQAKAAKRRAAAKKGAETVKRRTAKAKAVAKAPPATANGPLCPKCGRGDRLLHAGEAGLSPPTEPVPEEERVPGGPYLRPRTLSWPDDYFCDRCMRWCGVPLED